MGRRLKAFVCGLALALTTLCGRADATVCSVPNTFTTGATINAAPFNANFAALVTCGNAIDNTNIGSAGIYASQIIPTTNGQATFGGSVGYVFSQALTVINAYVAPSYTPAGGSQASTIKEVGPAAVNVTIANGASSGSTTVTLGSNAIFSSTTSYSVVLTVEGTSTVSTSAATVPVVVSLTNVSSSQFTIYAYTGNGLTNNSGSTQTFIVNFYAKGT